MKDNCQFCKKSGLHILPLRYSAVVGDEARKLLPEMPKNLGHGVSDFSLKNAKYAPRLMRLGYIYVLINRSNLLYWEAYVSTPDGMLYKFPAEAPPETAIEFNCNRNSCGIDASVISIEKIEFVKNIYILFTPTAMTTAKLNEYKSDPDGKVSKGQLQVFDPKAWAAGNQDQQHSVKPEQLNKYVPEFILYNKYEQAIESEAGKDMLAQLYPAAVDAYLGVPPVAPDFTPAMRLGAIQQKATKTKAAAFVIYDHIGITQELNNFRNAALEPVELFLEKKDAGKVSNKRKMDVMQAIDDVKSGFIQHGIGLADKQIKLVESTRLPKFDEENAKTLRSLGRTAEAEKIEERIKRNNEVREKNRSNMLSGKFAEKKWEEKYETLLDVKEKAIFRQNLEKISKAAEENSNLRIADHIKWAVSDRLVDAFETYDTTSLDSGFSFNAEHSLCTFGMFGNKENIYLLKEWMNITVIERKNLYMRANVFNSKTLQEEAGKAFTEARKLAAASPDLSQVAGAPWLKAAKGLIDGFKKTDSAWDEWLRDKVVKNVQTGKTTAELGNKIHNLSKFHRSAEGCMFARIAEWSQALSSTSGKLDKAISGVVGMLLYSKLTELAESIGIDEYMLKLKPAEIAAIKAKKQKTLEYQAMADKQKQSAKANIDKATSAAQVKAEIQAKLDAAKIEGSIEELIRDEQKKVKEKVKLTLEQMDKGTRPATNNFRQARLGALLMAIESLALTIKLENFKDTPRVKAEITASVLSLSSMAFDMVYAVAKSLREIEPYDGMLGVNKAADVMRGGLKMTAGTLSTAAGGISAVLDFTSVWEESHKYRKNWLLVGIYFTRGSAGIFGAGIGFLAAFSYCGPLLWRLAGSQLMSNSIFALRLVNLFAGGAVAAEAVAAARTLWLIRLARVNLIGLAITAGEVGYRCFIMDDDLENWCQACCFRKNKSWFGEKPFSDGEMELQELEKAFKAIK